MGLLSQSPQHRRNIQLIGTGVIGLAQHVIRPHRGTRQRSLVIRQNPLHQHRQTDVAGFVRDLLAQGSHVGHVLPGLGPILGRHGVSTVKCPRDQLRHDSIQAPP